MKSVFDKLAARPERSILILCLLLFLAGNWILPLTDRDEARFGEASREMLLRGDYVVPWFNDQWRLYKPALIYWCQLASYSVLGVNEFAARLPSALFITCTASLLVRWGRKIADAKTGFIAGVIYATGLHISLIGRAATADPALFFFFTLATWGGWELTRPKQPQRVRWWWIFYIALALGFLAKGPEAWLPLGAMVLGRVLRKDSFRLPLMETVAGMCLALALVASWGVPALKQTHGEFWSFGMGNQVFDRAIAVKDKHGFGGLLGFVATVPLYFLTFFVSFFPWSIRVPWALREWLKDRSRDDLGWYLLVVAALVFGVFSLVVTKLPHYTMPAFSGIALWLAWQIRRDDNVSTWAGRRLAVMVVVLLSVALAGFSVLRNQMLAENVWRAAQPYVRPETRVGCFGFNEASLVWKFRAVTTNHITLGDVAEAKNFLTNAPPLIIVVPTKDSAQFKDLGGSQINVRGLDIVKFKYWDLTVIVRP